MKPEHITLLRAWLDGEILETKDVNERVWKALLPVTSLAQALNFYPLTEYRVKPKKPQCRVWLHKGGFASLIHRNVEDMAGLVTEESLRECPSIYAGYITGWIDIPEIES